MSPRSLHRYPQFSEQVKIVEFVFTETKKIDALVTKKERLVELLQEKRTALISRAVTTGLDPDVPMKDSNVEWLGEIPRDRLFAHAAMFQVSYL